MKIKNASARPYWINGTMYAPNEVFTLTDRVSLASIKEYMAIGELVEIVEVIDVVAVEVPETAPEAPAETIEPEAPRKPGRPAKVEKDIE